MKKSPPAGISPHKKNDELLTNLMMWRDANLMVWILLFVSLYVVIRAHFHTMHPTHSYSSHLINVLQIVSEDKLLERFVECRTLDRVTWGHFTHKIEGP